MSQKPKIVDVFASVTTIMVKFDHGGVARMTEDERQTMLEALNAQQAPKPSERISELLRFNNEFEERARVAERKLKLITAIIDNAVPAVHTIRTREDTLVKALRWMVDNPGAHPNNVVAVAKDALEAR